jgi:ribulose-phosphate 3-epimerase
MRDIQVAPSILSADFGNLLADIRRIENETDILHIDVMDGHYVPNISFGVPIIKSIRSKTDLQFDVHLMITNPEEYIRIFAEAGADLVTFHIETAEDPASLIRLIHSLGKKAGMSVHPDTPVEKMFPFLPDLELVLIMSVYPGFGGQSFMAEAPARIHAVRDELDRIGSDAWLSVDGGVSEKTAPLILSSGATLLVAGSAVFGDPNPEDAIKRLKSF